ncbi:hypothetical protein AURDEDRAFT_162159 [Auricularia subglabra TFB-10046 SS5]|nr:hypothetical protein AURDEDRAFT_162159 [Auricularia subglabra TFB-10046 SS5]
MSAPLLPVHACPTCNWTSHTPIMLKLHRTPLACKPPCTFSTRCLTTYTAHRAKSHGAPELMRPLPDHQLCFGCRAQFRPAQLAEHTRVRPYACPYAAHGGQICRTFAGCSFAALKLHSWEVHAEMLEDPE